LAASTIRPGEWKIVTRMTMPGTPFPPHSMTLTTCYSPKQVASLKKWSPTGKNPAACKRTAFHVSGNTVTWTSRCTGPHPGISTGRITYQPNFYHGTVTTHITNPNGGAMSVTDRFNAHRIGPCR
ncbi:MAG: DUF3617 domain-containing protein, partial [Acidiferrobacteraceae bacterium]